MAEGDTTWLVAPQFPVQGLVRYITSHKLMKIKEPRTTIETLLHGLWRVIARLVAAITCSGLGTRVKKCY